MSQPNDYSQSFNLIVDEHFYQDSQCSQPWLPFISQTAQYPVLSPLTSSRPTMTASNPRFSNNLEFGQSGLPQQQFGIDPDSYLIPSRYIPRDSFNDVARHVQDGPWNPVRAMNDASVLRLQPNLGYGNIREGQGSDVASISDSGYGPSAYGSTRAKPTRSIISNEPKRISQTLSPGITSQMASMEVASAPSETPSMTRTRSDQRSNVSFTSSVQRKQWKCDRSECGKNFNCPSDHRKHMLKHTKPHTCDVPGCKRTIGFTTINDLDRHKKSLHKIGLGTSGKTYKCASSNCRNREKVWPRFDNFKQHVERMHKNEDKDDLMNKSLQNSARSGPVIDSHSVTSMDNSLAFAGLGTGSTYAGGHPNELISPISLTADQDDRRFSFGIANESLTVDIDQSPLKLRQSISSATGPDLCTVQEHMVNQNLPNRPQTRGKSSNIRGTVTCNGAPTSAHLSTRSSNLSRRAAQTKADQQKEASRKASKLITRKDQEPVSPSSDPVDLEHIYQLFLNQTKKATGQERDASVHHVQASSPIEAPGEGSDAVTLTKEQLLQALSGLLKQGSNTAFALPRRSTQGNPAKMEKCTNCSYEARPCDLRKHIKRHSRPYGCTYPECHKTFGAKSDWKRHENSQHFQLEAFRCSQKNNKTGLPCSQYFRGPEQFKKHLETHRKLLTGKALQDEVKRRKIGKNCLVQFWCGFCNEIMPLAAKRNAAWDERFNHIAEHFEKDKKSIDDWICVEKNITKGELHEENRKKEYVCDEDKAETEDVDAVGEIDDGPPVDIEMEIISTPAVVDLPLEQVLQPVNSRKRRALEDPVPVLRRKKQKQLVINTFCCSCDFGPHNNMHISCINCQKPFCDSCRFEEEELVTEGDLRG